MTNEKIEVRLSSPERYFTKCHHDFMDCNLLTGEEKIIFLSLKRFLDVKSNNGKVFPTIETIQKMTSWGKQKVIKYIKNLVNKGIVKSIRRGLSKPNVYILSDYPKMWTCDSVEEMQTIAKNKGEKPLTAEEHIAELKRMGYKVEVKKEVKEKEPVSGRRQATDTSTSSTMNTFIANLDNDTTDKSESQECYSMSKADADASESQECCSISKDKSESQGRCLVSKADADALLDRLWELYPVKKGKGRISVTQKSKLLKIGYEEMARAIERYKKYVASVEYLHFQNGSTFFNGGYVDYLDANYAPENKPETKNNEKKSSPKKNRFNDYPHRGYDFDAIKKGMFDQ